MAIKTKKIYDKGVYETGKYKSRINGKHTNVYNIWIAMIQRCYDVRLHKRHPSYSECSVVDEWCNFQTFAEWFDVNYIEDYQLDKDLLVPGNKIYSPDTCCFVPQEINISIIKSFKKRDLPVGVHKRHNKYVVYIKENKFRKYIGTYDNIEDASARYINVKQEQLKTLATLYKTTITSKTYNALLTYIIN